MDYDLMRANEFTAIAEQELIRTKHGCYIGGYMAAKPEVSVRELKNQTTAILRRVEGGERVTITKRGRPVAVLEPSSQAAVPAPDSIYRSLQRQIEARHPRLRKMTEAEANREFERISRKIARTMPYKSWQEMDRAAKGDRFGFSRQ